VRESIIFALLGWIPTWAKGTGIRRRLYRPIFARIGAATCLEPGVELIGAVNIELGDQVYLCRHASLDAGHPDSTIRIGNRVTIGRYVGLTGLKQTQVEIGDDTFINGNVMFLGAGNIKIGRKCLLAPQVSIIASNRNFSDLAIAICDQGETHQGVVIEDNCWLGHRVTVLDGVTIGEGSVIGAGAVVTKDIPPYSIAVGVPARVVASRKPTDPPPSSSYELASPLSESEQLSESEPLASSATR
jgi:acetyltransferase-like isoleucine patch superfamily enzyme